VRDCSLKLPILSGPAKNYTKQPRQNCELTLRREFGYNFLNLKVAIENVNETPMRAAGWTHRTPPTISTGAHFLKLLAVNNIMPAPSHTTKSPMSRKQLKKSIFLSPFLVNLFATEAYAYLDPGTGSYLFQIMLASLVGALFAVKTYWNKIKEFVKKFFHKSLS
jgi:hypothetical protein